MIKLMENNSRKFCNGAEFTNKDGDVGTIIGKVDRKLRGEYRYFLLQFESGSIIDIEYTTINNGKFVDPARKLVKIDDIENAELINA